MTDFTEENPQGGPSTAEPPVEGQNPPAPPAPAAGEEGPKAANVRLSRKREADALPEGLVNIGMESGIHIPNVEAQLEGFYVEQPSVLINQFPQYKYVQKKGQPKPV